MDNDILKKASAFFARELNDLPANSVIATEGHSCDTAWRVLEVSRAGYYQHQQRGPRQADVAAMVELKADFADSGRSYGSGWLVSALQAQGRA